MSGESGENRKGRKEGGLGLEAGKKPELATDWHEFSRIKLKASRLRAFYLAAAAEIC